LNFDFYYAISAAGCLLGFAGEAGNFVVAFLFMCAKITIAILEGRIPRETISAIFVAAIVISGSMLGAYFFCQKPRIKDAIISVKIFKTGIMPIMSKNKARKNIPQGNETFCGIISYINVNFAANG
jgi:uncharacterized PurR-regulated membrane protein YhhQ (DUF165 family)